LSSTRAREFIETETARLKVLNKEAIGDINEMVSKIDSKIKKLDAIQQEIAKKGSFRVPTPQPSVNLPAGVRVPNGMNKPYRESTQDENIALRKQYDELLEERKGYIAQLENLNGDYLKKELEVSAAAVEAHKEVTKAIKEQVKQTERLNETIPTMTPRTGQITDEFDSQLDKDLYSHYANKAQSEKDARVANNMQMRAVPERADLSQTKQDMSELIDYTQIMNDSVNGLLVDMTIGIAEGLGHLISGTGSMSDIFDGLLGIVGSFMKNLGESLIQTAIAAKAFASVLLNPIAAIAAGVALIALGTVFTDLASGGPAGGGSNSSPRKFADGGVVFGPTFGLLGEYANASRNPEVVAPLSRLESMLNKNAVSTELYGRISGSDLYLSNKRQGYRVSRITGGV
jgi:hypothetical protein